MGFTNGCRYWSILQLVAIILCYRGNSSDINGHAIVSTPSEQPKQDDRSTIPESESTTDETQISIRGDATDSTLGEHAGKGDIKHDSGSEPNSGERQTTIPEDAIHTTADDQSGAVVEFHPDTEAESSTNNGQAMKSLSPGPTSIPGVVICCLIIVLVITILIYALYQRRKNSQAKPVATTEVGNRPNEADANVPQGMTEVYNRSHAAQGTSQQYNDDPNSLYTLIEETPAAVYRDVKQTESISKDGQSERVATDKAKAVTATQAMELNVYTTIDKSSTTTSTDSTLDEVDQVGVKGLAENGDCSPDHIYSLASNAKETAVDSPAQLEAGIVPKAHAPQDDGCQTVIENDLYGIKDNSAKETLVESPTHILGGIVSKGPAPQDDGGQTVIENELHGMADNNSAKEIAVESPPSLLLTKL